MPEDQLIGERIAYHRKRLGLSQVEFAGLVGRSESWVSQVERGVRPVDRMSVLQKVADVLSVSVAELRGDDETSDIDDRPEAFDTIRLALTGHPAIASVLGTAKLTAPGRQLDALRRQHEQVWELVHASRYSEVAPILAALIPGLETATRTDRQRERPERGARAARRHLPGHRRHDGQDRRDRRRLDRRRPGRILRRSSRVTPGRSGQHVPHGPRVPGPGPDRPGPPRRHQHRRTRWNRRSPASAEPEVLSLYGASHLVLAVAAARDNRRSQAREHLDIARKIAGQLGQDRDDYGTEFGPTNVAVHAVDIAVELGDAGQAIELAEHTDAGSLSPERQARYLLDLAQAHAMRRQIGEALHALQEAERIAPEETRVHYVGRAVTRDLLQLSGLRPRPELRDLAERFGVLP